MVNIFYNSTNYQCVLFNFVHSLSLMNLFLLQYPNAVGCTLSVIQLALFVIYPRRSAVPLTTELHNHHHPYPYIKLMDA